MTTSTTRWSRWLAAVVCASGLAAPARAQDRLTVGTVEVVASKTALDTQQVSSTTAIDEQMVQAIPLNGRNFTDLVKLTAALPWQDTGALLDRVAMWIDAGMLRRRETPDLQTT